MLSLLLTCRSDKQAVLFLTAHVCVSVCLEDYLINYQFISNLLAAAAAADVTR
jgi:hypothetical protein